MVAKRKSEAATRESDNSSKGLSPAQLQLFAFVRKHIRDLGSPPTLEDVRRGNEALSHSSIAYNIRVLERRGYLLRKKTKKRAQIGLGDRAQKEAYLWKLVDDGFARWNGGKPGGSKHPIKVTPGPPISDYIIEERERLRGPLL